MTKLNICKELVLIDCNSNKRRKNAHRDEKNGASFSSESAADDPWTAERADSKDSSEIPEIWFPLTALQPVGGQDVVVGAAVITCKLAKMIADFDACDATADWDDPEDSKPRSASWAERSGVVQKVDGDGTALVRLLAPSMTKTKSRSFAASGRTEDQQSTSEVSNSEFRIETSSEVGGYYCGVGKADMLLAVATARIVVKVDPKSETTGEFAFKVSGGTAVSTLLFGCICMPSALQIEFHRHKVPRYIDCCLTPSHLFSSSLRNRCHDSLVQKEPICTGPWSRTQTRSRRPLGHVRKRIACEVWGRVGRREGTWEASCKFGSEETAFTTPANQTYVVVFCYANLSSWGHLPWCQA